MSSKRTLHKYPTQRTIETVPLLQLARQILEAHTSLLNLSVHDAKLQYIRNWQALQDFGITVFLVKIGKSKKEVGTLYQL